ncbi:FYVE, RhoGEF and PH domain-containing protein 5-like [Salvelinus sp. IW2-2015]|uniref:FYVE, RhoGEF and PH domain-containing protein 5-like n=1 Tax=Salvelinus sp. IW2-2015 TaxID=2691554 RepID=UPI000CDF9A7D|nr:FYVE, RhoGEF and PH domain-containing protein 5-like [Salvelinus alpinus]
MNTDLQKRLQVPRPKIRSHLTIKVQSKLMSKPCPSTRGPKPPTAAMPRPSSSETEAEEEQCPPHGLSNGDLTSSEGEPKDHKEGSEDPIPHSTNHNQEEAAPEEILNDITDYGEKENEQEEDEIERENKASEIENTGSSDTHIAAEDKNCTAADDLNPPESNNDGTSVDPEHHPECDNVFLCERGDEEGGGIKAEEEDNQSFAEETETSDEPIGYPEEDVEEPDTEDHDHGTNPSQLVADTDSGLEKEVSSPGGEYVQCKVPTDEAEEEAEDLLLGAHCCTLPPVGEEYPYDVIGPSDEPVYTCDTGEPGDTGVWQPERATKDPSGHFRFSGSTEDVFGPYSVIEAVPADWMSTADPEVNHDETFCGDKPHTAKEMDTAGTSNQEPYYLSSDDVEALEDKRRESEVQDTPEQSSQHIETAMEDVDEYADIDDSLCPEAHDFQQLDGASSEDYVEIGDDDETDDMERKQIRGRSVRERTAKREQAFSSQRNSCQPRLRLCNITVPADLDRTRTPELTNRVVFAHTTEAFEEDIEELDCHIVPYQEDSDSDSEEHIYEEAGFDSEGENFMSLDRKSIVTRSRSYSGKVSGYVPETVPEETSEYQSTYDYCTVALDQNGEPLRRPEQPEVNRLIPSLKPRHFLPHPNSYSAEGRELSLGAHTEADQSLKDDGRMKRTDDTLSLPCFSTSSGSFSQRSHQSSSDVSMPTSLVDIPPPFELAYITKRPITKSSPSLLISVSPESTDSKPKKNKSSFKRFLALKFKRKTDTKGFGDGSIRSSRSSSESSHHGPTRILELERRSTGSPQPQSQSRMVKPQQRPPDLPSTFLLYKDLRKEDPKAYGSRGVSRVESFEERSRRPLMPLPLTKPRSISFPSADTSEYENIPAMSSDYENIQIRPGGRPTRSMKVTDFFEDPKRIVPPSNDNDGYVDMNSFPGIDSKPQSPEQEPESAYTEPFPMNDTPAGLSAEEDHGLTSEEEEGGVEHGFDKQIDGRSRAFYVAKELVDSERLHVKALKLLQEDFRAAVSEAVGEDGEPVVDEQRLGEILGTLPEVYILHSNILTELDSRIRQWEESQRVVDVILSRREEFAVFATYISEYDRSMSLLAESCKLNPAFHDIVKQFEKQGPDGAQVQLKHQLLQVIVRVLQYRMLLTDYLNNLSPDSKEYEDTQAALVIVSEVADQANENLKQGENLLRLVHIEYSVRGKRDLLKPGRVFVKEGTLMKVSRKSRQPRHLFLMNDVMLYTYPQQDGKYRLKNTLYLSGMKVSIPVIDNVLNALRIEVNDISITLSASSCGEREDWFHTLSRAIADHAAGLCTLGGPCSEAREKLWMALGETAPVLVPVTHVMMCMNCTSDFSMTLRRHHCNACGKVVCRACSRNKYPLKYLKDRMAKVCDHCYAELRKIGVSISGAYGNSSPCTHRASRPLSAVFQSFQPPSLWRSRKSTSSLNQVVLGAEGSAMSGSLQRRKKSKRKWKRLWFLLKDKVLYTFTAREDKMASEILPLQSFTVKLTEMPEGEESSNVFQLYHKKTLYYTFRADDQHTARRWVNAMEEATVL